MDVEAGGQEQGGRTNRKGKGEMVSEHVREARMQEGDGLMETEQRQIIF